MAPYVPKGCPLVDPPQTPPIAHAVLRAVAATMPNSNIGKSPPVGGGDLRRARKVSIDPSRSSHRATKSMLENFAAAQR